MQKNFDTVQPICRHITPFGPPECEAWPTAVKRTTTDPLATTSGDWLGVRGDREQRGRCLTGVPVQLELPLTDEGAHHD